MVTTHPTLTTRDWRRSLAVLAAGAGLALAGCGSGGDPGVLPDPATPVAPQEQTVQWTDSVCNALAPVVGKIRSLPTFDLSTPQATQQAYSSYLAEAKTEAERALQAVSSAGFPPVEGGEQIAKEVRDDIAQLRDDLGEAKAQLDQADPNNPAAIGRAALAAGNVLGALANQTQALGTLDGNPQLDAAFEQARSCEQLRQTTTVGG